MTIDVNVNDIDEATLEDIDEIIEDTMVQMFFLQPKDAAQLASAKAVCAEHEPFFYAAPATLAESADANCIGYRVSVPEDLTSEAIADKPLFVEESDLDEAMTAALKNAEAKGIVLDAVQPHETLESFYLAIGPGNVKAFNSEALSGISMDRIALQSGFPDHGFDEIFGAVKTVSDALFRPEQSIIARATKQTLHLTGFKK